METSHGLIVVLAPVMVEQFNIPSRGADLRLHVLRHKNIPALQLQEMFHQFGHKSQVGGYEIHPRREMRGQKGQVFGSRYPKGERSATDRGNSDQLTVGPDSYDRQ